MEIKFEHTISVEAYNELRKAVDWNALPLEQAERSLKNTYHLLVASHGGKKVGLARLISDGGYVAYIADVIVLPEYQGNGIGKALMEQMLEFIQMDLVKEGPVRISLFSTKGKEAFYKQFGFIERPTDDFGAGMFLPISNKQ